MLIDESPQTVLAWLAEQPTLARTIGAAKRLSGTASGGAVNVRYAVLRNVTVEPALPASITIESARLGMSCSVYLGDFDNVQGDVYDPHSPLYASSPDLVVLALRLQVLAPRLVLEFASLDAAGAAALSSGVLERVCGFIDAIRAHSNALILVHNFERPVRPAYGLLDRASASGQIATIDRLNARLATACAERGAHVVDLDAELSQLGYDRGIDDRYWHLARSPYSLALHRRLAGAYARTAAALKGKNKKCLVLDCDNTLWGGVVGEDGIEGIALGPSAPGSAFVEFQAAILDLYHRGILLALNSKNDEADVLEVLEHHPDCLLRPAHFAAMRVNWNDKASNLRSLAEQLNLGLDAFVFVDDNPAECRLVRDNVPAVTTIELPKDPSRYARLLRDLPYFDTLALSDEDRRRTQMYQAETRRTELRGSSTSLDEFLRSLEMELTIRPGDALRVPRIAQLTQKTNQFNLTTRRYAEADIEAAGADPARAVFCAELSDTFDSSGIVAAAILRDEGEDVVVDTFLMSCRVIGRGIEDALIAKIAADARARGRRRVVGEYLATQKNGLVRDFYERFGFRERPGSDRRWWTLELGGALPAPPAWFKTIVDEARA
jgi:FkbH-like protein